MFLRTAVCLLVVSMATNASAQGDEEIIPLPLPRAKPKPRPKAKPKPKPKPAQEPLEQIIPLPVARTGEVKVKVTGDVSRATLSIDGKEVGQLPLAPQTVSTGEHTISVRRPGYAQFVKKVTVPGGKQVEVDARLTPVAAVISVQSDVDDAQVLINGRLIGTAPVVDYEFPPGPVTISVIREGFKEDKKKLTLVSGQDYPIEVRFKPAQLAAADKPIEATLTPVTPLVETPVVTDTPVASGSTPVYQRWYFWVGIGAAVAAAAAGTAIGINAANAPPTRLTEAQICGQAGGCDGLINFAPSTAQSGLLSLPTRR